MCSIVELGCIMTIPIHNQQHDVNPEGYTSAAVYTIGDYKLKDYNEWKLGVQAILYF